MSYQRVLTDDVFAKFAAGELNKRGECRWANRYSDSGGGWGRGAPNDWTVACEDDRLFSYRVSFPLAVRLQYQGAPFFLRNGDPFSVTTKNHQYSTQSACQPGITVSFTALHAAGIHPVDQVAPWGRPSGKRNLTGDMIVDVCEDTAVELFRFPDGRMVHRSYHHIYVNEPFAEPPSGMAMPDPFVPQEFYLCETREGARNDNHDQMQAVEGRSIAWHRMGGLLLRDGLRYLLCGIDEGNAFVSQLPSPADTIEEAVERLKPPAVQMAERAGTTVKRQGEWFCIPAALTDQDVRAQLGVTSEKALRAATAERPLPFREQESNRHVCPHFVGAAGALYARGRVRHLTADGRPSGEHRMLKLEGWHRVVRNTEIEGWSVSPREMGGAARFD